MPTPPKKYNMVWTPFREGTLGGGRDGIVLRGPPGVVVKIPRRFQDDSEEKGYRDTPDVKYFEHERAMLELMQKRPPHPNIIQALMSADDGICYPYMQDNLELFLDRGVLASDDQASVWVAQIASAAAWLESMDLFHGDLRPPNIRQPRSCQDLRLWQHGA
ncbi:hypothetical protein SCUCBS95973_006064 [Sporothrix curviconia]|uniref:Protein kinase domain-containing protein n=1 Tax=Sporothrix curviconia TaxID=1260050 RepID=A0ABP0C207_9PEZI